MLSSTTFAAVPSRRWRVSALLVVFSALALAPAVGVAAAGTGTTVLPQAGMTAQRMPRIHVHGSALNGGERTFSVDDIDRLALLTTWKILDPYKRQECRYTGILLKDLVDALAPKATHVRMRAVNDYVKVFERCEWQSLPIMLATRDGDVRTSVANKGPARVVFLQTAETEMAMQVHAPKWIWQVVDVEFQSR